jgi:hypothetical protein
VPMLPGGSRYDLFGDPESKAAWYRIVAAGGSQWSRTLGLPLNENGEALAYLQTETGVVQTMVFGALGEDSIRAHFVREDNYVDKP